MERIGVEADPLFLWRNCLPNSEHKLYPRNIEHIVSRSAKRPSIRLKKVAELRFRRSDSDGQRYVFGKRCFVPEELPELVAIRTQFNSRFLPVFGPPVNRCFPEDPNREVRYSLYVDLGVALRRIACALSFDDVRRYGCQNFVQRKSLVPRLELWQ